MRNIGRLPPTLFLIGSKGLVMLMPESLADEIDKNDFAAIARLMCIAHVATGCVMALEAWVNFAKPGEKFDETEPPSEAFDRQEVVVLLTSRNMARNRSSCPSFAATTGSFSAWANLMCSQLTR